MSIATGPRAIRAWLRAVGEDPDREGLRETPRRVAAAWAELLAGYGPAPRITVFSDPSDELIVVRAIEVISLCEHHVLPFVGTATVGYIPAGRIIGLSKIPRLVQHYSRRLQVQERLTAQIAAALQDAVTPLGVGVVIRAKHLCTQARGIRANGTETITSAMLGVLRSKPEARAEFLALARSG